MKKDFDAIVIGAGQSGAFLTARMAATGQRVAIIERRRFGGACVNTGCVRTKPNTAHIILQLATAATLVTLIAL